ncbi:MAG: hypothetical protein EPO07_12390 [Verrucomicrobia bacterium]|nr:MAG: hypothetical protein EPO07_12390 [Verrucomicrobiota bacterium]
MARWHSCNVLHVGPDSRRLWQFDARNGSFALDREQTVSGDGSLPGQVNKTWRSLWQPKLNVALLPPENVFLRVAQLPRASVEETLSMVELQLEKLSPIPVTQVVWSIHPLEKSTGAPRQSEAAAGDLQTVIVLLAERKTVEEYLGRLEGQGYLADRLELPVLDQLLATKITGDGAWIYPGAWGGAGTALVAWWQDGVLQNLTFISAPPATNRGALVGEQLTQMAWAGELEGWLKSRPTWHLVADEVAAAEWEPLLHEGLGELALVEAPLPLGQIAALTARRAGDANTRCNLLPAEYSVRYRQQFADRLWMRGLFSVVAVYLVGVAIYFAALGAQKFRTYRVEHEVAQLSGSYTNTIEIKTRAQKLKDRADLQFAALDCWRVTAELMPEALTLDSSIFADGRKLTLRGTAPKGEDGSVLNFSAAMRKATVNNKPLFDATKPDNLSYQPAPGGLVGWTFSLELKGVEESQ